MRNHADILRNADLGALAKRLEVSFHTARSWIQRDSIPAEHWSKIVEDGVSTLEELSAGVRPRKARAA